MPCLLARQGRQFNPQGFTKFSEAFARQGFRGLRVELPGSKPTISSQGSQPGTPALRMDGKGWVHDAGLVGRPVEMICLPAMGQASYISIQTHQTGPDDNKQVCLDVTSSFGSKLHTKSECLIQFE
tara:strand:+ start:224 stop:601 length:378 start_codon:yes stop_codon:yes gene_type:complete